MKVIDLRGLACPAPVISIKKTLEKSGGETFQVILDNGAPLENVIRFCSAKGCTISLEKGEHCSSITVSLKKPEPMIEDIDRRTVILIASDRLGDGADDLGRLLMKNFIITLLEIKSLPEKIIFMNSGVLLSSQGSELIEPLTKLSDSGVEILSCGLCLDYYGMREKLSVGEVSNMYTIAESILSKGNLVRI